MKRILVFAGYFLGAALAGAAGAAMFAAAGGLQAPRHDAAPQATSTAAYEDLRASLSHLAQELSALKSQVAELSQKPREEMERQMTRQATGDDALVTAVARVMPSVVSIVATKEVPRLRVEYVNPFGNDPFFRGFDIRIPVYRQEGTEKKKIGAASGFLVTRRGLIITNRHVVADPEAEYTVLLSDGTQKTAEVRYRDPAHDLALLDIEGDGYPAAPLGDASRLRLGERVAAIGNALGEYANSVSTGIVSGLDRTIVARGANGEPVTLKGIIQTDAAINPGNSGGPLINLRGEVVGVNVATVIGSENISFSIPINEAKRLLARFINEGRP